MAEHKQFVPADKADREKFAEQWRADRDFKESEKTRRFAAIEGRRKKGRDGGKINIEIKGN